MPALRSSTLSLLDESARPSSSASAALDRHADDMTVVAADELHLGAESVDDADLWPWRMLLLGICVAWGANFAIVKEAADSLGNAAEALTLFTAARFALGFALLSPFLLKTSSCAVFVTGGTVGILTTLGYAAQVASVGMGTQAGTAAFICSLNAVVVALLIGQKTGFVSNRTWWAIGLSVLGVGCLELPAVIGGGEGVCMGDLVAFGQPLGFGASYVLLEQALTDHPEDELPLAALQVLTTCLAALAAASCAYGAPLWALPWGELLPHTLVAATVATEAGATDAAAAAVSSSFSIAPAADWSVAAPLLYSGVVTSALTIWLQMIVFSKLPAVDASLLLTTEPLWAALAAVLLLGDVLGMNDFAGGALIVLALCVNQGLIFGSTEAQLAEEGTSK